MGTSIWRVRGARPVSLAAAIALLAMLLPATAGIALGHAVSVHCDQITNDTGYGTAVVKDHSTHATVIVSLAAGATQIVAPGTYDIVWNVDGYTQSGVVVGKCGPTISTVASPASGTVGVAMTVGDTATVSGAVAFATGSSVTFSLYKGTACTGTPVATGSGLVGAISVGKATAAYSKSWTPTAAGTYTWGVGFAGDAYNNSYSACGGSGETVTIIKASPTIATVASPNSGTVGVAMTVGDIATLSGGSGFGSSDAVAFALYSGVAPSACNGPALVSGSSSLSSGVATFSASWTPSAAGTYTWGVNFAGDTNNNAISACGGAHETVTVVNKAGITIVTQLSESTGTVGDSVYDTATLSVIAPTVVTPHAVAISPTVTYTVYTDTTCRTKFQNAGTVTVAPNGVVPNSNSIVFNTAGTYYWQAVYSGDNGTTGATSPCMSETLVIDPTPFESFEGETAFPSTDPSKTPFESFQGETSNPTRIATLPPTSSDGNATNDAGTPLFLLLISMAFGVLGLVAVKAQRRSLRA